MGESTSASSVPGAAPAVVGPYLAAALGDPAWAEVVVTLISGGKSNLTYQLDSPAGSAILRRPPLGHVLPTAHDMVREHTVMSALGGTAVPVPTMLHLCTDPEVLGAPFYVMQRVDGFICRDVLPPGYADQPAQRRAIGDGLVDVLARLHEVDPAAVGLAGFGRPEGFLGRQVKRWTTQWDATRIDGHGALDTLAADLAASVPASTRTGIVHGDYRLDNTMLSLTTPGEIAAVLDWELCTLGDPTVDLAMLLVYWSEATDTDRREATALIPAATVLEGFPTRREVVDRYADRTGADLDSLPWCVAFGFFKLAVICAGIVTRARGGSMLGPGFDGIEGRIGPLVEIGRRTLADGEIR